MSAYRRDFDETRCVSWDKNHELLEKYNAIWKKSQTGYYKGIW